MQDKGGHRPFTAQYNKHGRIQPEALLNAPPVAALKIMRYALELSFKEREPTDSLTCAEIAESVAYWAPYIDTGVEDLNI